MSPLWRGVECGRGAGALSGRAARSGVDAGGADPGSCGNPVGTSGALAEQMGQRLCYLREVICGWSAQDLAWRLGARAESIERMDLALERERGRGPRLLGIRPPAASRMCGSCSPMRGWWCLLWREEGPGARKGRRKRGSVGKSGITVWSLARALWVRTWEERAAATFAKGERSAASCSSSA